MILIRLDNDEEDFDSIIAVTEEEYKILHELNEKYGTIYDAYGHIDEKTKDFLDDIKYRESILPEVTAGSYRNILFL